jgi:ABC-2 type transport system ATP-binding protein
MNDLAIWTENLVKVYPGVRAVDGLSLNVPRGVAYGFLGRNGAGKTSTIRILLGLARATEGRGTVLGFAVGREQVAILQRTAYVSESKNLYGSLTPRELVRFTCGFYPNWSDQAVAKYSRLFEIPMDRPFAKLSQGNRTKAYLLLALSQGADLLVLDEPATGLDPVVLDEFLRILVQDVIAEGRTVFISSHQLSDVEQIADWIGLIDHGRLLLEARLDDIKNQFRFITVAGNGLPQTESPEVLLLASEGNFHKYLVKKNAEAFAA